MPDLSCSCGQTRWTLSDTVPGRHIVCYCKDCQSFARHLDRADMLAEHGGTHLWQTVPEALKITQGAEHLTCLRLGPKGLLRWYAACCGTPIANTLPKPTLPFVGAVLPAPAEGFGKVQARVMTEATRGAVKQKGFEATGATIILRALGAWMRRRTRGTFFDADGQPVRVPQVLTKEQRAAARP